jgi:hypothetical protein
LETWKEIKHNMTLAVEVVPSDGAGRFHALALETGNGLLSQRAKSVGSVVGADGKVRPIVSVSTEPPE